jgi:hypothetical protein
VVKPAHATLTTVSGTVDLRLTGKHITGDGLFGEAAYTIRFLSLTHILWYPPLSLY